MIINIIHKLKKYWKLNKYKNIHERALFSGFKPSTPAKECDIFILAICLPWSWKNYRNEAIYKSNPSSKVQHNINPVINIDMGSVMRLFRFFSAIYRCNLLTFILG